MRLPKWNFGSGIAVSLGMNSQAARYFALASLLCLASSAASYTSMQSGSVPSNSCAQSLVSIDGNRIWVDKAGSGNVTVVFESGFGNDSTVWSQIAPRIRAAGFRTFVYDRAGMGQSSLNEATPFSLENDVISLEAR
ncbi:MAG TPA: alpha/beta hydrolase [Candidatus Angelobacter sp.]|nr:alpha/beta hydrolase [Candidatus Angelobacter sp.]